MTSIVILAAILAMTAALFTVVVGIATLWRIRSLDKKYDEILDNVGDLAIRFINVEKEVNKHRIHISNILMTEKVGEDAPPEKAKEAEDARKEAELQKALWDGMNNVLNYDGKPPKKEGNE